MSKSTLAAKLSRVAQSVTGLKKDGYNSHHKYKFVSHDSVVDSISKALSSEGVDFTPQITNVTQSGKNYLVEMLYKFTDSESGESQECKWFGEGQDSQDKGLYKAVTQAKKTFLLNKFLIATGEQFADGDYGQGYESRKKRQSQPEPEEPDPVAAPEPEKTWADLPKNKQQSLVIRRAELIPAIEWAPEYKNYGDWIKKAGVLTENKDGDPSFASSTVTQINRVMAFLEKLAVERPKQPDPPKDSLPVSEATRQAATANGVQDPTKFDPPNPREVLAKTMATVKAKDIRLHSVLADARPSISGGRLQLSFADGYDWHYGQATEKINLLCECADMPVDVHIDEQVPA